MFKTKSSPNPGEAYIRDIIAKPVRQFITAGDADQEVPAKSIFTPLFIRGLEGDADYTKDGYVTGSELGVYLTQTLRNYTSDQSPQYGKIRDVELDRGDIVFRSLNKPNRSSLPNQSTEPSPSGTVPTKSPNSSTRPTSPPLQPTSSDEPILISKATGVNYAKLRDLLEAGEWKEADIETSRAMLQAAKREKEGWFREKDLNNFACEDLRLIDQFWRESSQGKFGFRVQKEIYQNLGGTREYEYSVRKNFSDQVGWRQGGIWLSYKDLSFNLNASRGHLPVLYWTYLGLNLPSTDDDIDNLHKIEMFLSSFFFCFS